jgi:type II secretory pathway component PulF
MGFSLIEVCVFLPDLFLLALCFFASGFLFIVLAWKSNKQCQHFSDKKILGEI